MSQRYSASWDENSIYRQYLSEVSRHPLLTREEERALLQLASKGNRQAIDKLVLSNLRFVINTAFMYKGQGLTISELINEGNLGLIKAAERFDVSRDIKFISYAVWWVRQSITRAIAEKARLVRISAEKELVLRRFNRGSTGFKQTIGGAYTLDYGELAEKFGYTTDQVEQILQMGARHTSFDAPLGDDGDATLLEVTADETETAEVTVEEASDREQVILAVEKLPELEKKVITLYYGIGGEEEPLNLVEIGKLIGLSKERVRQIKEKGLASLREMGLAEKLEIAA